MSALQPIELWQQTHRDEVLKDVMLRFKDRRKRDLCLAPTHEEEITEIAKRFIFSYKQLPVTLYQIQTKFRDEVRPRFGLMRSCEFIMKDAYSFDADEASLDESYAVMFEAYSRIFTECGLNFVTSKADSGAMGGSVSHEFMVPAAIGEDALFLCAQCNEYFTKDGSCSKCKGSLDEKKMIEVGHVFKLGTKYSKAQGASFLDNTGKRQPLIMGCYGIGVSRLIPAIIEQNNDAKGIIWPKQVSPFQAELLVLDKGDEVLRKVAQSLYHMLTNAGVDVLFDERDEPAGVKFNDAYLLGIPFIIIVGKKYKQTEKFEVEVRESGEKRLFTPESLHQFIKDEYEA